MQQKHIIVTCNYAARRRGLHKLQLIREARKTCPDVIIVLGEDLTRFRKASKDLYNFLKSQIWSGRAERLGFDEVFLDVSDIIDFNLNILNYNSLSDSFFHLDRSDPEVGFLYDASYYAGNTFPSSKLKDPCRAISTLSPSFGTLSVSDADILEVRLRLGSHLAQYLRHQLEEQRGYTSTVGISTNKLLSKLVGNVNKPNNQTTLRPPYLTTPDIGQSNVLMFMDDHEIGKIPGIGCKLSHKLRNYALGHDPKLDEGPVWGPPRDGVKARDVRLHPVMGPDVLAEVLKGPGSHKDTGSKVWGLLHGVDNAGIERARIVPRQISIEDSYLRLDTLTQVKKELYKLTISLIRRMHLDLTEADSDYGIDRGDDDVEDHGKGSRGIIVDATRRWLAHPRTLRLSTRPRPPTQSDGTRSRAFKRISRSTPLPSFVFRLNDPGVLIADKLVDEVVLPLFSQLHPEASDYDLSLINVAVTDMMETASDNRNSGGRDIGRMFKRQDEVLKNWRVEDRDVAPSQDDRNGLDDIDRDTQSMKSPLETPRPTEVAKGSEDEVLHTQASLVDDMVWDSDDDGEPELSGSCSTCGAIMPPFAMAAHERFHLNPD